MKRIKLFENFDDHLTVTLMTQKGEGMGLENIPGGSLEDIMSDYEIKAIDNGDGSLTVSGDKSSVTEYLEDYGNEHLLDCNFADDGIGVHEKE